VVCWRRQVMSMYKANWAHTLWRSLIAMSCAAERCCALASRSRSQSRQKKRMRRVQLRAKHRLRQALRLPLLPPSLPLLFLLLPLFLLLFLPLLSQSRRHHYRRCAVAAVGGWMCVHTAMRVLRTRQSYCRHSCARSLQCWRAGSLCWRCLALITWYAALSVSANFMSLM
jgi:hypothetical protein